MQDISCVSYLYSTAMQYKTFTMAKNKPACSKGGCESGLFFKYTLSFPNLT